MTTTNKTVSAQHTSTATTARTNSLSHTFSVTNQQIATKTVPKVKAVTLAVTQSQV